MWRAPAGAGNPLWAKTERRMRVPGLQAGDFLRLSAGGPHPAEGGRGIVRIDGPSQLRGLGPDAAVFAEDDFAEKKTVEVPCDARVGTGPGPFPPDAGWGCERKTGGRPFF